MSGKKSSNKSIQVFVWLKRNHLSASLLGAVSNGVRVADKKRDKKSRKSDSSGSSDASGSGGNSGNKFSTTWRPVGDYIHLKIQFCVQDTNLQVLLPSRIQSIEYETR